jgi:hypothetical protein
VIITPSSFATFRNQELNLTDLNDHTFSEPLVPEAAQDQAVSASSDYEPRYPPEQMDAAHLAALTARPSSPVAIAACRDLLEHLLGQPHMQAAEAKVTLKRLKVFGALVADLLERDPNDNGGWLFRSTSSNSFSGDIVGYRPFMTGYSALVGMMVEEVKGHRIWGDSELLASGKTPVWQRATRFRATPRLRDWFSERGIDRGSWKDHFKRGLSAPSAGKGPCPVVLRAEKPPHHFRVRKGHNLPIDKSDPLVAALIARMGRINDYLGKLEVEPYGPVVLRRIFSNGDNPKHAWRQGGRLYAIGSTTYQTAKKVARRGITINGKPTSELDIQASHVTILAGLGHIPRFQGDPYEVDGIPRSVVKKWVQMTLSHGRRHLRWPPDAIRDLQKDHGIDLKADYPLSSTAEIILRHLPILKYDGSTSVAVGWGELQFRESEIILAAMEVLAFEHDVPALPIHDSLMVPEEAKDLAKSVLGAAFKAALGLVAVIA